MRQIWDIHGGVHPPENKWQTQQEPIGTIPLSKEIILPLSQHIGAPAAPIVKIGDTVLKGQLIAEAQGIFSATIHASTSGTVLAIEERFVAHPSGLQAPCIVIKPDSQDQWIERIPCDDIESLDHTTLIKKVQQSGLAGMGGAGFPTAVKLNPRATDKITTLILNGTECEPYITADDMLMRHHADDIIQGALLIARIVGKPEEILIGVEDNKPEAIEALQKAAAETNIQVVPFPTKYPSGGEKQLIQILTGKEVPSGKLPSNLGILVQNVGTAYATWRAIRHGEPLVERITTVVGESLTQQRNIRVPLGTPINHILEQHGHKPALSSRLIIGGPMMGYSVEQAQVPVVKTTNCILAPSKQEMPEAPPAQACIRCGMCSEACPAQLLPQQLLWYAQAEDTDKLQAHNLFDCIECGACSFVCPSAIPLVQYYRAAKGTIKQQTAEKQKSDHARLRFEQRQERIAIADAAKEAKRAARKKAAEAAKKKLAEKKANNPTGDTAPEETDLVAAAIAKAKAKKDDPETQRKKLARALSSAQSRIERIGKQLVEHKDDETKAEKLRAQLKQGELKVKDAQAKLDQFDNQNSSKKSDAEDTNQKETPLEKRIKQVDEKLKATPLEAQIKAVAKIEKTLATAKEKALEAEKEGKPTVTALKLGVEKLTIKLTDAKSELEKMQASGENSLNEVIEQDAASSAIARAQAKAAALANMDPKEKRAGQIESLKKRIDKSKEKLAQAEAENSEHADILKTSLGKLEAKLVKLEEEFRV